MKNIWEHLKKSKLTLSLITIFALLCVSVTYASLVASDSAVQNTFAFGEVHTKIEETLTEGNKIVTVKNTGEVPAYVRVRVAVGGVSADKVKVVNSQAEVEAAADIDDYVWLVLDSTANTNWGKGAQAKFGLLAYNADDFYYYQQKLIPGASTTPLLSKVYVGSNLGLDETNFSVSVYQEAVVAKGDGSLNTATAIESQF